MESIINILTTISRWVASLLGRLFSLSSDAGDTLTIGGDGVSNLPPSPPTKWGASKPLTNCELLETLDNMRYRLRLDSIDAATYLSIRKVYIKDHGPVIYLPEELLENLAIEFSYYYIYILRFDQFIEVFCQYAMNEYSKVIKETYARY